MQYFEMLSADQIEEVHAATLQVMEQVGLDFGYEPALEILSKGGVRIEGKRAFFHRDVVEAQMKKAPGKFTLHARNPENNLEIGGDTSVYLPANCPPFIDDKDQGRRYGTLEDFENLVKLTHSSSNLDMCSNILVEPNDVPIERRPVQTTYACFKYSDKCFMGSAIGSEGARHTLDMASMVFGDAIAMAEKPCILSIPCSLTPLCYDDRMLGAMIEYAKAGQPQMINSLTIAGATAPATLAGALVVQNAEILAGIVLTQLIREGTPVVYASGSSSADMRTGALAVGAPEMAIHNVMAAQMARFYGVPSRAVGALTDAKLPDAQAGYESMMNLSMAQNCGINIILHAAGALETINCVSYEKFVIDDEMVGMVKRIGRGVETDSDALAVDVIQSAGPGGQFLDKPHTFKHCRSEFFQAQLSDRSSYDQWEKSGSQSTYERANAKWKKMLDSYQAPDFPESLDKDLNQYMANI
jgi:trimethylamine--corrinoid protein Co-methyltransferase